MVEQRRGFVEYLTAWLAMPERVSDLEHRMSRMGVRMTAVDDAVDQLNAATDEVAADLERLRAEVAGSDGAAAAKLDPIIARLRSLGVDPENPVPEPPPEG